MVVAPWVKYLSQEYDPMLTWAANMRIDNAEHATRILMENIVKPLKDEFCGIPQGQWPQTSSATLLALGSLYMQSRDGTRIPLEGGCNTFAFCKVLLSTIYQAVLALICVPHVPAVCDVVDSSLVPGPSLGMQVGYQRI